MFRYSLDGFLKRALGSKPPIPTQAEIQADGFLLLCVRISQRLVELEQLHDPWVYPVLDIYKVEVKTKGIGTFTRFLDTVRLGYPNLPIFIEEVFETRFAEYLKRNGFEPAFNVRLDVFQQKLLRSKHADSFFLNVNR